MKKIYILLCILLTLVAKNQLYAQLKELKIGDKVPDLLLGELLFSNQKSLKLSDLKGKLVIIDFWGPSCTPCVAAMPKMDSLQIRFGDKIKILPVVSLNKESYNTQKEGIAKFWKGNSYTKRTTLTTLVDTTLKAYFPYVGLPYEVWINGEGILVGLTQFANEKEIQFVLDGNFVNAQSARIVASYDYKANLLAVNTKNLAIPDKNWHTAITSFIPGRLKVTSFKPYSQNLEDYTTSFKVLNLPILSLYQHILLQEKNAFGYNRNLDKWVLEVSDSSRFIPDKTKENAFQWIAKNSYCYEAVLPGLRAEGEMYQKMKQDIDVFFNLKTKTERRIIDCWIIVRTSKNDKLLLSKKKANEFDESIRQGMLGSTEYLFFKTDIKEITRVHNDIGGFIDNIATELPVINETGITMPVRLAIVIKMNDGKPLLSYSYAPNRIKEQLKQYGLDLIKTKREMEVFVITDKDIRNEKSSK
jgi:thiol-disulfide isomerase/thioredoxin